MTEKPFFIKKIFFFCFIGLVVILGIVPVFLIVKNKLLGSTLRKVYNRATTSFSQQYPFEEDETPISTVQTKNDEFIGKYMKGVQYIANGTDVYLTTKSPFYFLPSTVSSFLSKISDKNLILDGYFIKLDNGYLADCFVYCPSKEAWNNIQDFSTWLKNKGIPFMAVIQPDKGDDSITVFPEDIPHGYSKMIDEYKAFLSKNDVKYMEAKPILLAKNSDFYSWFYKSDSHCNVYAGYVMAQELARHLKNELCVRTDTEILNPRNFIDVVYPNSFLGDQGKKLGEAWKEDMTVLYPAFTNSFRIEIPGYGVDKTGTFNDTLIEQKYLGTSYSEYAAFFNGNYPLVRVENKNCQNGTRVLVIKKCYANVVLPYLACTVQYLDVIEPSLFDGSIHSFIEQTKPDVVLLYMGIPITGNENFLSLK